MTGGRNESVLHCTQGFMCKYSFQKLHQTFYPFLSYDCSVPQNVMYHTSRDEYDCAYAKSLAEDMPTCESILGRHLQKEYSVGQHYNQLLLYFVSILLCQLAAD